MNISDLMASSNGEGRTDLADPLALRFRCPVEIRFVRKVAGEFEVGKLVEILAEQIEATLQKRAESGDPVMFSRYPLFLEGNEVILKRGGSFVATSAEFFPCSVCWWKRKGTGSSCASANSKRFGRCLTAAAKPIMKNASA